jgi:hypothetical protein
LVGKNDWRRQVHIDGVSDIGIAAPGEQPDMSHCRVVDENIHGTGLAFDRSYEPVDNLSVC